MQMQCLPADREVTMLQPYIHPKRSYWDLLTTRHSLLLVLNLFEGLHHVGKISES